MGDNTLLGIVLSVSGAIISAMAYIIYRLYERISHVGEDEIEILVSRVENLSSSNKQVLEEFKVVLNAIQTKLCLEEFKLKSYEELSNKIFRQIEDKVVSNTKRLDSHAKKINELDTEIKIIKTKIEE